VRQQLFGPRQLHAPHLLLRRPAHKLAKGAAEIDAAVRTLVDSIGAGGG
jgi:hypothetical protein